MNKKDTLTMLNHYVGHARLGLEEREEVDNYRLGAIGKLKKLGEKDIVKRCIGILEDTTWKDIEKVEEFERKYDQLNPKVEEMKKTVDNLFRDRKN